MPNLPSQIKQLMGRWVRSKGVPDKVRYAGPRLDEHEYEALLDALFDDWWSGGKYTLKAERKLAAQAHRRGALLVNSGSSANLLAVATAMELGWWQKGDHIATLSCGFPTTVAPLIQLGLVPVFVDIDLDTLAPDMDALEDAVLERGCAGAFVAHTLGWPSALERLHDLECTYPGFRVLYDCCDAYGTVVDAKPLPSWGRAATYSFYVAHHLTMGEGGALVSDDEEFLSVARSLRGWGRYCAAQNCCVRSEHPNKFCPEAPLTPRDECGVPSDYMVNYQFERLGYNLKPLELQAAMLAVQIDRLPEFNGIRQRNYDHLWTTLAEGPWRAWPRPIGVSPFAFPLLLDEGVNRGKVLEHMRREGIEVRLLFGGNLTRHPAFERSDRWVGYNEPHTNADAIMDRMLMLGVSQVTTPSDVEDTIKALREATR